MSMCPRGLLVAFAIAAHFLCPSLGQAQTAAPDLEPLGIGLESLAYPYPVQYLLLRMEGEDVKLAFMDVEPSAPANGKTVVLMHGRNFGERQDCRQKKRSRPFSDRLRAFAFESVLPVYKRSRTLEDELTRRNFHRLYIA